MAIKAVKKPVPQEFIQVTEDNILEILEFDKVDFIMGAQPTDGGLDIDTIWGLLFPKFGDYLSKDSGGAIRCVPKADFNENYEIVNM